MSYLFLLILSKNLSLYITSSLLAGRLASWADWGAKSGFVPSLLPHEGSNLLKGPFIYGDATTVCL